MRIKCTGKAIYTRPARLSYDAYAGDERGRSLWEYLKWPFTKKRYIHGSERIELDFKSIKIPITSYDQHSHISRAFRTSDSLDELLRCDEFNIAIQSLGSMESDQYDTIPGYDYSMPDAPWLFDYQVDLHVDEESAWQKGIWSDTFIASWIEETLDQNFVEINEEQQQWPQKKLVKWIQAQFPEDEKAPTKRGYKYFFNRTYLDDNGEPFTMDLWDNIDWIDKPISGYAWDGAAYDMELRFRDLELDPTSIVFLINNTKINFEDLKTCYEFVDEQGDDVFLEEYKAQQEAAKTEVPASVFQNVWLRTGITLTCFVGVNLAKTWEIVSPDWWLVLLLGVIVSAFVMRVFLPTACATLSLGGFIGSFNHLTEFEFLSSIGNLMFAVIALWFGAKFVFNRDS